MALLILAYISQLLLCMVNKIEQKDCPGLVLQPQVLFMNFSTFNTPATKLDYNPRLTGVFLFIKEVLVGEQLAS